MTEKKSSLIDDIVMLGVTAPLFGLMGGIGAILLHCFLWLRYGAWIPTGILHIVATFPCVSNTHDAASFLSCREQLADRVWGPIPNFEASAEGWHGVARLIDWTVDFFAFGSSIMTVPLVGCIVGAIAMSIASFFDAE